MKNGITDILSALFSQPSGKTGLSQGAGSVSPKGSQSNGSTFEDVLAQLASEESPGASAGNGSTTASSAGVLPASSGSTSSSGSLSFAGSTTSISETDITITEKVKVDNLDQLAQAEQALMSLASGLSKLLGSLTNLQAMEPSQAQNALVSLSGGKITAADAQSLLNSLQAMVSQLPDSKNPLLLSQDQQNAFLNQMLQQMVQNQQVLFGAAQGTANAAAVSGSAGGVSTGANALSTNDVFLQMAFSDTQITQVQPSTAQSSSVFINLQTFQMSATFIQGTSQNASGSAPTSASFQAVPVSDRLTNELNQLLANQSPLSSTAVTAASSSNSTASLNTAGSQTDLGKNLNQLVQMLVQGGVGQAVLTTFLNQPKDNSNADLRQSLAQTASLENLTQSLSPAVEIPAPPPAEAVSTGVNNTDLSRSNLTGQALVEQMFVQAPSVSGSPLTSQAALSAATPSVTQIGSNGNVSGVDIHAINALDDAVARLSVFASNVLEAGSENAAGGNKPSPSLEQLVGILNLSAATAVNSPAVTQASAVNAVGGNLFVQALAPNAPAAGISQTAQIQGLLNHPGLPQSNQEDVVLISKAQLVSAVLPVEQGTAAPSDVLLGNNPVNPLSAGLSNQVSENNFTPNVSTVLAPLTVQTPVGLSPSAQPVPAVSNTVTVQSQPVSPVSPTVQEVVAPNPIDVQVKVSNLTDNSTQPNTQIPAATTPGTTVSASTAQNVSASVVTGEVVKLAVPTQNPVRSNDLNNPISVNSVSAVSAVQPLNPQAVTSVTDASNLSAGLRVELDQAKNTNNNSTNLPLGAGLSTVTASIADKAGAAALNVNQAANNQVQKIDSLQILNQVADQVTAHASDVRAVSRMSFQLIPESLGRVTVQIALVDQAVSAKIIVSNPEVREALQHHMVDLKAALNQAGLQIDQLQVQIQGGSSNLLAQYYQYQQEGSGYGQPVSAGLTGAEDVKNLDNTGVLGEMSVRTSLVDVLA